tara:strand:- start:1052 stop:1717 length:666 start_codon:yes stop_codon:yes gene_type:complete
MRAFIKYLDFRETIKSTLYSVKLILDIIVTYFGDKKTELLAITSGSPEDDAANVILTEPSRPMAFHQILRKLFRAPKNIILYRIRGLVGLYRDLKHYYTNFYLKSKPISSLYPEYKSLNIGKSLHQTVSNTGSNYSGLSSWRMFLLFFQYWVIPGLLGFVLVTMLLILRDIPVNKFLFMTLSVGFFLYLLLSGFVFFFKKYKYSKYTTAMSRYWRRTFSIF